MTETPVPPPTGSDAAGASPTAEPGAATAPPTSGPTPPPAGSSSWGGPGPRVLLRRDDDKVVAGVCAAFGRYTGTDPVLWRVVVGVLTFFGGAGLCLYLAGWLLVPRLGSDGSVAERALTSRPLTPATALLVGVTVLAFAILVGDGRGFAAVAVLALFGWLVVRERSGPSPAAVGWPAAGAGDGTRWSASGPGWSATEAGWTASGPGWTAASSAPAGGPAQGGGGATATLLDAPPPGATAHPPLPPVGPSSRVGAVTLALVALTGGALSALRLAGVEEVTAPRVLAACLVVTAGGLLVGAVVGRARWLFFFPGLVLALALGASVTADGVAGAGVGERTWLVAGGAPTRTFELGVGEATLDLRGADTSGRVLDVSARIGVGHLVVVVPDDVTVRLRARAGLGELDLGDAQTAEGSSVERTVVLGEGDVEAELDVRVGMGEIEVRRG
jgi:phage shock protein PspC (stress-responsive transcriptional regulator)